MHVHVAHWYKSFYFKNFIKDKLSVGVNPDQIHFQTAWLHFTLLDYLFTFKAEDYS